MKSIKTFLRFYSVSEYAKKKGLTRQAVLKRIKRNALTAAKVGKTYIIID